MTTIKELDLSRWPGKACENRAHWDCWRRSSAELWLRHGLGRRAAAHVGDFFSSMPLSWIRRMRSEVESPAVRGIGTAMPIFRGTL